MSKILCQGSILKCNFGTTPATLTVLPQHQVMANKLLAATIMDNKPLVNIPSFGSCSSSSNPIVASATAAANGALTPMPCTPMTSAPWNPGTAKTFIAGIPVATEQSICQCGWGGVIEVTSVAQTSVDAN